MSDAVNQLQREGYANASETRIWHAIRTGHITRPQMDGSGRYRFGRHELQQIRTYLANVPRRGRPPKEHAQH